MSDSNSAVLQRAYELVEAGQADEARSLVESVLDAEQTNPDAWWIYAHAIDDPVKARQALNEVLNLDPEYPGANELVGVLDAQYPDAAEAAQQATPLLLLAALAGHGEPPAAEGVFVPESAPGPTTEEFEPAFVSQVPPATMTMAKPAEPRRLIPWWWYVAVGGVAILILALFAALFGRPGVTTVTTTASPDVTVVAGLATLDTGAQSAQETVAAGGNATAEVSLQVTLEGVLPQPVGSEGTAEAASTLEIGAATSESVLPSPGIVATLPTESFVTLTPSGPEATLPVGELPTEAAGNVPTVEGAVPTSAEATDATPEGALAGETPTAASTGLNVPNSVVIIVPAEALAQLVGSLSSVSAPPESALTTEATPLGETLVASFCTQDGPELRNLTRQVMDTVSAAAPVMADTTGAVGARAVDCATGETLRLIVADRATATLYTQGEINREGFESQWISL